jgi:serine/threonine-protein kinase
LLAGRYRIVALLGRGGMGEVYRANDLKLGQPVALKFLPEATGRNETVLARFYNEIRIARQVSHPNVCRVYDLGEVEGQPYLSMEYVDGENLGSLLRRIGRLPEGKALEIARKLCAGLAAAHEKGVLHRDLKPANIMLDGRGHVLITDFGLAGLADQLQGAEVRNGTPAYMAPEQLAGKEVSIRSDIYSLGLVLYEIFTGKRAFEASTLAELVRLHSESTPVSPSSHVKDLDPAVERVILRCLDTDPRNRPASALAVAAALPGGDPLAAALAAGETPSPQMVAASGETAGLPLRIAVPCLAAVLVALAFILLAGAHVNGMQYLNLEKPPEVLREKARDFIRSVGYTAPPVDQAHGFSYEDDFQRFVEKTEKPPAARWPEILSGRPTLVHYWYRQSQQYMVPSSFTDQLMTPGIVTPTDPPATESGMIIVELDSQGRLNALQAIPPEVDKTPSPAQPFDWKVLFSAAGLDPAAFQPATPEWNSLAVFDARAAWTGNWPGTQRPLRIEAAAWRAKPVYFALIGPWTRPARMQPFERSAGERARDIVAIAMLFLVLVGAVSVARWNLVRGRGDRRGAFRLAFFVFCVQLALWLTRSHFVPAVSTFGLLIIAVSTALFISGAVWVMYLAVEPYVRRHWPQTIIAWSRLSGGRMRDPLVGRDVLFGACLGVFWWSLFLIDALVLRTLGAAPGLGTTDYLLGARGTATALLYQIPSSISGTLIFFFLIFLLRVILRKQWLAAAGFTLIYGVLKILGTDHPFVETPLVIIVYAVAAIVVVRFGLVALASGIFTADLLANVPLTTDFSAWYAGATLFPLLAVAALAVWGFYTALAGRPLLKEELFE